MKYYDKYARFKKNVPFGQKGEEFMVNVFLNIINSETEKFRYQFVEYGKTSDWDFKALKYAIKEDNRSSIFFEEDEKDKLYVEVKADRYQRRTGNMFIELKSRGKDSGLRTTKSNWYIYFFVRKEFYDKNIFIIETEKLKELVSKYEKDHLTTGGDDGTSLGVVLPISEVCDHFKKVRFTGYEFDGENIKPKIVQEKELKKSGLEDYLFGKLKNKNENEQH